MYLIYYYSSYYNLASSTVLSAPTRRPGLFSFVLMLLFVLLRFYAACIFTLSLSPAHVLVSPALAFAVLLHLGYLFSFSRFVSSPASIVSMYVMSCIRYCYQ